MPHEVNLTGPDSRRPVFSGSRRIVGLYERRRADGVVVYEARYRRDGGKPKLVKLDATTKTDAIAELEALKTDQRRGERVHTSSLIPTFDEVAHDFLLAFELRTQHRDPSKRRSPRTLTLYRQTLDRYVLPTLGPLPIDEVDLAELRRLIDKLGAKLAPNTVTGAVNVTSSVLRHAVRKGLVERNPVRDLDRDDRPGVKRQTEPRYLSADEVRLLLSKMGDTFRPVAAVLAYGGLRVSEALGLKWSDLDFDAKSLSVRHQLDDDGVVRERVKTTASASTVRMLPALERELREHRRRQAGINLARVHRDELVFTTANGKPQSRDNARRAINDASDAAGLNPDGAKRVGNHDLRHSFVSLALDSGATLAEAAVLARHASARVTSSIYAGVSEKAKAEIASKLVDAGFGA
jgi:integrase